MIEDKCASLLCGRIFPVPRRRLQIIQKPNENPLDMFSAIVLRYRSLLIYVSRREFGGPGFRVKISGAVKA